MILYFCHKKMFSKSCEYAIRASIFIATHCCKEGKVGLKEIANEIDSPIAFTAKILQVLVKNNIIKSSKGVGGGFMILKDDLKNIKLSDIVIAIDGDSVFLRCGLGLSNCSEDHPCPVHEKFKFVKKDLIYMLEHTTLEELSLGIKKGQTFLKY
jgi:Rrf2 family iron-sulfur cluster assembly transcriptional regulator